MAANAPERLVAGQELTVRASAPDGAPRWALTGETMADNGGAITLCVREGTADVWIDDEHVTLTSGQLVIVPAGRKHGFSNAGTAVLHIESTLAAPVFEAAYEDKRETPRRWLPAAEVAR